ncbi:MAG: SGNH/GDSL hydrolase family protein [Planctomycetes bacterium]|nr:SGNH/GDSL hydrolase family protein [Planctomycetota bacterium]
MVRTPAIAMLRKLLFSAAIGVVALAAGLGGFEWYLRGRLIRESGATDFESLRSRYLGNELKIFALDESGEIDLVPKESQGQKITINAQGFRGKAVAVPKPDGLFRVVLIGGSACFGTTSTNDDTTIAAFLQRQLRAQAREPEKVEVVNGGLPGATTARAVTRYERKLAGLKPDVVILYNMINDLLQSRRARLGFDERFSALVRADNGFERALSHSAIWLQWSAARSQRRKEERAAERIAREERTAAKGLGTSSEAQAIRAAVASEGSTDYDGALASNRYIVPEHFAEFRAQLDRFHGVVSGSGAAPVYCTYGFLFRGNETQEEYRKIAGGLGFWMPQWSMARDALAAMNEAIREAAARHRAPLCDVATDIPRQPRLFKDTDHLSDEGCRGVAAFLATTLSKAGLLRGAAEKK